MKPLFFAVLTGAALAGCSAPVDRFALQPVDGQEAVVRKGVPALISSKKHTVLLRPAAAHQLTQSRPRFVAVMLNRTKKPVTFSTSSISVTSVTPKQANLRVYSHAELTKEVEDAKNAQMTLSLIAGALGAVSASQAGHTYSTGHYTYGGKIGTYSHTTYNPALARAALDANTDQTLGNMTAIEHQAQAKLAELEATIIRDHTLMPGEWHGGVIVFDPPVKSDKGKAEYLITLALGGEKHTFKVSQQSQE